jgi:hypothetical protein
MRASVVVHAVAEAAIGYAVGSVLEQTGVVGHTDQVFEARSRKAPPTQDLGFRCHGVAHQASRQLNVVGPQM